MSTVIFTSVPLHKEVGSDEGWVELELEGLPLSLGTADG